MIKTEGGGAVETIISLQLKNEKIHASNKNSSNSVRKR